MRMPADRRLERHPGDRPRGRQIGLHAAALPAPARHANPPMPDPGERAGRAGRAAGIHSSGGGSARRRQRRPSRSPPRRWRPTARRRRRAPDHDHRKPRSRAAVELGGGQRRRRCPWSPGRRSAPLDQGPLLLPAVRAAVEQHLDRAGSGGAGGSTERTRNHSASSPANAARPWRPVVRNTRVPERRQHRRGRGEVGDPVPAVAGLRPPARGGAAPAAAAPPARTPAAALACIVAANGWVASTTSVDPLRPQPGGQPVDAAEAADADLARRQPRVADPAGQRADQRQVRAAGEPGGQRPAPRPCPRGAAASRGVAGASR